MQRTQAIVLALGLLGPMACAPKNDTSPPDGGGAQACTKEAKLCPDGSSVGRSGPNCEFDPCPGEGAEAEPESTPDGEAPDGEAPDGEAPEAEAEPPA